MHAFSCALISSLKINMASTIPHLLADLLRFPLFLILPSWYLSSDWYTWVRLIHTNASGEKGIWPDFIFRHLFSAFLIYCPSSLSILLMSLVSFRQDLLDVCAAPILSISRCLSTFSSRILTYLLATLGILVFRRREEAHITLGGAWPIMSSALKYITNIRWSPMP
jgi:hypothetical protein